MQVREARVTRMGARRQSDGSDFACRIPMRDSPVLFSMEVRAMTILREWRAEIRTPQSKEYVDYIRKTGLADYRKTPGNLGAMIAVREIDKERTEVITLSLWSSLDAIRAFAGEPVDQARYYPEDEQYLLTHPDTVKHYEAFGELTILPGTE
jgi:hypothetical protein